MKLSRVPGQPIDIVVRVARAPDGRAMVLLQLPDGFVLLSADDAETVGAELLRVAAELD